MKRFLALSSAERREAFDTTARVRGLRAARIAKDFWVCLALRELFDHPEFGAHLTFKGGTSLSKAWWLIDRFSEDVDLMIDHETIGITEDREPVLASSQKERGRRIAEIKNACQVATL